jgi:hypothetical protein
MEVNNRCSELQLEYKSGNVPEMCGGILSYEKVNVETVGWVIRSVKEEPTDEFDEKMFESRDNAANECEIADTKREYTDQPIKWF